MVLLLTINFRCAPGKLSGSGGKNKIDYFHTADFPARVESIQFSSGGILSASSTLRWGSWTVSFPVDKLQWQQVVEVEISSSQAWSPQMLFREKWFVVCSNAGPVHLLVRRQTEENL